MKWLERCIALGAAVSVRHRRRTIVLWALLALLGLIAATRIELHTSNLALVDPEEPAVQRFVEVLEEFGGVSPILVVVSGAGPEAVTPVVEALGPRLRDVEGVSRVDDRLPIDPGAAAILGIDPFLRSRDGGLGFLFVDLEERHLRVERLAPIVHEMREVVEQVVDAHPGIEAGLTGMPVYAVDDRDHVELDLRRLGVLSLMGVTALFAAAFGRFRRPVLAMLALCAAIAVSLGLVAGWPGHLTLLSAFFASILLGLGVDFGIHVVDRWEDLEETGVADPGSAAVAQLGRPLVASAGTTASVLALLYFCGFRGFAELGVIAAVGVLLSLAASVTLLPALLAGRREGSPGPGKRPPSRHHLVPPRSVRVVLGGVALVLALVGLARGPQLDRDYLALQPADSQAVRWEREMVRRSDWSPGAVVFVAEDEERMKDLTWLLSDEETVGAVRSLQTLGSLGGLSGALPEDAGSLVASLVSPEGRYAVWAMPAGNLWDPDVSAEFLDAVMALDPEATGMPILGDWMIDRSLDAMQRAAALGGGVLVLWVAASFRRPLPTLLALLPTAVTVTGVVGALSLVGQSFNSLSVLGLPVLLGLAVDDGVHLVHGFLESGGDAPGTLHRVGRSLALTSATTGLAFGVLALADHRGLASFGLVVGVGVLVAWAATLGLLPPLLERLRPWLLREPGGATSSAEPEGGPA